MKSTPPDLPESTDAATSGSFLFERAVDTLKIGYGVLTPDGVLNMPNAILQGIASGHSSASAWWEATRVRLSQQWGGDFERLAEQRPLTLAVEAPGRSHVIELSIFAAHRPGERILLARDVTDEQHAQQSLESLGEELRSGVEGSLEKDRRMADYLEAISARLRTPLNTIRGYSELLMEDAASGPMSAELQRIHSASTELLEAIHHIEGQVEAEHARRKQSDELRDLSRALSATLDLSQVLDNLLDSAAALLPYDAAAVWLHRHGGFTLMAHRGRLRVPLDTAALVAGNTPAATAVASRRAVAMDDVAVVSDWDEARSHGLASWCGVPLVHGDEVVGFLSLESSRPSPFSARLERLGRPLAAAAGAAIHNARAFSDAQHGAVVDELTGVPNHRHFVQVAQREFDRAIAHGRVVSAMMVDVDDLAQLNAAHGRAVGDEVLKQLATRCAMVVRDEDVFGRFSGEEFALLLPETNGDNAAHSVAERLRQVIAAEPFASTVGSLTISVGIGVAEARPTETLKELLERALAAVREARRAGLGRVQVDG